MKPEIYKYQIDGERFIVLDSPNFKSVRSKAYNYDFNKESGFFARWGRTKEDDPNFSPIGPEIWDCEATTACDGVANQGKVSVCSFCYKANNPKGQNLSFDNFKAMVDRFPKSLTQIAFGADSKAESNPDLFKMMKYCRETGVIPNITVSDISDDIARQLCEVCGAVAVSRYNDKNVCYDIVKKLTDGGLDQTNIHCLLAEQTFDWCMETAKDSLSDPRLAKLNAIVFLSLKKKGRAKNGFESVSYEKFRELFLWCLDNKVSIGFDSCSAPRFMNLVENEESIEENVRQRYIECCEPCESGLFSFYTGIDSCYYPCSFTEGESGWKSGLSLLECDDFFKDIWYHPRNNEWRKRLIESGEGGCRQCLTFPEINKTELVEITINGENI